MKFLSLSLVALIALSCSTRKHDGFLISGSVKDFKQKEVYLVSYINDAAVILDTATIDTLTGKFQFTGKVEVPDLMYVTFPDGSEIEVFVENASISVSGDSIENSVASGTVSNEIYKAYKTGRDSVNKTLAGMYKEFDSLMVKYRTARAAGNDKEMKMYYVQMAKIEAVPETSLREYGVSFVRKHPASFVSPAILWKEMAYAMDAPELEAIVKDFDTSLRKSNYIQYLNNRIEILKKVAVGQPALEFEMKDTLGNPQKLSSYFGKVLLVDFWASWCGPCRRENPNVVAAYRQFTKKGFDILGVSFDNSRDKWVKAIHDDKLSWHHISELKGWKNSAASIYSIRLIPSNMLLDKNGTIIAKNLMGDDLIKKLTELLK